VRPVRPRIGIYLSTPRQAAASAGLPDLTVAGWRRARRPRRGRRASNGLPRPPVSEAGHADQGATNWHTEVLRAPAAGSRGFPPSPSVSPATLTQSFVLVDFCRKFL